MTRISGEGNDEEAVDVAVETTNIEDVGSIGNLSIGTEELIQSDLPFEASGLRVDNGSLMNSLLAETSGLHTPLRDVTADSQSAGFAS